MHKLDSNICIDNDNIFKIPEHMKTSNPGKYVSVGFKAFQPDHKVYPFSFLSRKQSLRGDAT